MHNNDSSSIIITRVEVKSKKLIGTSCYNFGIQLNSVELGCCIWLHQKIDHCHQWAIPITHDSSNRRRHNSGEVEEQSFH
jgi:hypothetical protein